MITVTAGRLCRHSAQTHHLKMRLCCIVFGYISNLLRYVGTVLLNTSQHHCLSGTISAVRVPLRFSFVFIDVVQALF